ncbi:MAG: DNA-processing protein DprA [Candidatus Doudnabacteria bacterium]|nr:DNA-processing protein DprA [Candidatus Doudnabacteria bacterium]
MANPEEEMFANALNLIPMLGPVRLAHMRGKFGTYEKAWMAKRADYVAIGFNPKLVEQIVSLKEQIDPSAEYGKLGRHGISIVLINSGQYPDQLKEISAAPPILYIRGQIQVLNTTCIAVVGTRKITVYGKRAADEIVGGLVSSGLTIASGLAYGIDGAALTAALNNGGRTIAVLATPLDDDSISPRTNYNLAQRILESGCIISEYGLGASVQKQNFPIRNRILSGLGIGTLVIEADVDSGSLITASYALEQNREVFAVPGSIFSEVSRGTNNLIKKGAKLVTTHLDILEELNLDVALTTEFETGQDTTDEEQKIIDSLSREPVHIDELVRALGLPAAEINSTLVMLEMKGRVKNFGGAKFAKIR